jgi:DNA polymerase III epsilon subunit-like protein
MSSIETDWHWNGNLLAAIDIETTGLDFRKDEILEIAIVPLAMNLKPHPKVLPFEIIMKPDDPSEYKNNQVLLPGMTLVDILNRGVEKEMAAQLLIEWFERIPLPERKRIIPLGQNYMQFDRLFLKEWLTDSTYDYIFDYHTRDTMVVALALNDMAAAIQEHVPFPKVALGYLSACLKVSNPRRHRALGDAVTTAEVYRKMVTQVYAIAKAKSQLFSPSEIGATEIDLACLHGVAKTEPK